MFVFCQFSFYSFVFMQEARKRFDKASLLYDQVFPQFFTYLDTVIDIIWHAVYIQFSCLMLLNKEGPNFWSPVSPEGIAAFLFMSI